ncbi:MAG TPA: hypothetical protein VHV31_05570 [Nitrolancea sp.]|jgi:hypothetical protein|nr:hypothetical protein [Nitrolancea sp.]
MKSRILPAALGAMRCEFNMQLRRKAVWIALLGTSLIMYIWIRGMWRVPPVLPLSVTIGDWAIRCNALLPVVYGVLLADRLPRDQRLHLTELLDSLPAPAGSRLTGKYLGSALAIAVPIFLAYCTGIAAILIDRHDPLTLPLALVAFVAIILPGLLFVAAFSVATPAILWVPLYQFLFVGYWFWGNLLSPVYGIPTLSDTLFTPVGRSAAAGFFNNHTSDIVTITGNTVSGTQGALSILLLLGGGALALLTAHRYLTWQRAHQ